MVILEQLFSRNFDLTHQIFQKYLDDLLNSKFPSNFNPLIYDNILSAMGLLPRIYKSLNSKNPDISQR